MTLASIRKAIVPAAVAGVLALLNVIGVDATVEVSNTVALIVTAVLVYLIPNN